MIANPVAKKYFLLAFFLFCCGIMHAQKNKGQNFHWVSGQMGFGIMGGQYHPDMTKFNDHISAIGGKQLFILGLRGYGATFLCPVAVSRAFTFDGAVAF